MTDLRSRDGIRSRALGQDREIGASARAEAAIEQSPAARGNSRAGRDELYVFLASSPYSGSTLLSLLLGRHPEIATVSDVSGARREAQMTEYRCSCGRLLAECEFWQRIVADMHQVGYRDFALANFRLGFDRAVGSRVERIRSGSLRSNLLEDARDRVFRLVPGHEESMRAIGRRNVEFAHAVLRETGKNVFVDASKERMRIRYLRRYLNMPLRVIHLIRDVRGVVDSASRHATARSAKHDTLARVWARTNGTLLRHAQRLPLDRRLVVRYEDLCRDPDGTLAELWRFCGVDPDARTMSDQNMHLLGNRRRLEGPTEIRLDERWKSAFTLDEQRLILRAAGPIHRRFYPEAALL